MLNHIFKIASSCLTVVFYCLIVSVSAASAQRPVPVPTTPEKNEDEVRLSPIEEEMRVKRAIQAADKAHQQNVSRARDLADLSATLLERFTQNNGLDRTDFKKLDKAEKLAKSIRESAGGSEDRCDIPNAPTDVGSALRKFSELSKSLKEKVEKTSKHVVSAAVIDEANVLLELIRRVRTMHPKV